jgi:CHASE3 domain sensor protein
MSNKDMPDGMRIKIALDQQQIEAVLMALRTAQSHVIFNEDRKAMRELAEDIESTVDAALAELERRG